MISLLDLGRRYIPSLFQAAEPETTSETDPLGTIIQSQNIAKWRSGILQKYQPATINSTLDYASTSGEDLVGQWEIYDAMESKWPRCAKNSYELKTAVASQKYCVHPFLEPGQTEPSPSSKAKAELIERCIANMDPKPGTMASGFEGGLLDICDAVGKGVSVCEINWEREEDGVVVPDSFTWVHPYFYGIEPNSTSLKLKRDGARFEEWPENKFIISIFKTKSGSIPSQGLLRPLAWYYSATLFSNDWMLRFAERFGIPMRVGTYNPSLPDNVKSAISSMLENMGSAGWAALPEGVKIELVEAVSNATNNPQAAIQALADKNCDLIFLGQTLTSDVGDSGSRALGDVHERVMDSRIKDVATWAAKTLSYQLVPAILKVNFGDDSECPEIKPDFTEEDDPKVMADRDAVLATMGMPLSLEWLRERHGIPMPEPSEEMLTKPQAPATAKGQADEEDEEWEDPMRAKLAIMAKQADLNSVNDRLMENVLERLTGVNHAWLAPAKPMFQQLVAKALDKGVSDEDFRALVKSAQAALPDLFDKLDTTTLQTALEAAIGSAVVNAAMRREMEFRK